MKARRSESMTPKERLTAWRTGQPYDRIPCGVNVEAHAAFLIGLKPEELTTPQNIVNAQIAACNIYGQEVIGAGFGIAEALGSNTSFVSNNTNYTKSSIVNEIADLERLEIPDSRKSDVLAKGFETLELMIDKAGTEINIQAYLTGPLTMASRLRGTENLMRDIYYHPEFVHQLLAFCVDATLPVIKEVARLGVDIAIMDPVSSGSLISPVTFRTFSFPYLKKLITETAKVTSYPSLHICGNTHLILEEMADCGASLLMNLDQIVDLTEVKMKVGHRIAFSGNLDHTASLLLGTPEIVEKNVKQCLKKAWDSPRGFILSMDGLPSHAPPDNVRAVFDTVSKIGKYPYNPALFN